MLDNLMNNWKLAAGVSAAVASTAVASMLILKNKSTPVQSPKRWVRVGTVSEILLYPIKSCQGVNVDEASASIIGLKASDYLRDRVFMVVDSRQVFQTQRTIPKMALIHVEVNGNQLTLSSTNFKSVVIDFPEQSPELLRSCRIFDDKVASVLDCGDEVGKWLDEFLGKTGLRLMYHHLDKTQRTMVPLQKKFPMFVPSDKGAFQDQTSYMLMSEDSIADLNTKLETVTVSHRNFRPSIVIKDTPEPFAEDFFGFVKVGNEGPIFKASKPCTRCKLTTVNPDTGEFIQSGEPLSRLVKMQRTMGDEKVDALVKNQGIIGLQLGLFAGEGKSLKVGDSVYAAVL